MVACKVDSGGNGPAMLASPDLKIGPMREAFKTRVEDESLFPLQCMVSAARRRHI